MTTSSSDISEKKGPIWFDTTPETEYESLDGNIEVETAVVGGGIVGTSVAYGLSEAGQSVTLLERDRILTGVTGHTTAKLTAQHSLIYDYLIDAFGTDRARQYATANQEAIDQIESRVNSLDIDCAFERTPSYTYTRSADEREQYESETKAAASLGLPASYTESLPETFDSAAAVRVDDQAQFNPRQYLLALVEQVAEAGNSVLENTKVTDLDPGNPCELTTTGGTVTADTVVLATHFPVYDKALYFARLSPKRSYVLAAQLAEEPPTGMFYRPGEPYFSVRPRPTGDESSVLIGGQNHRTAQGSPTKRRYKRLETQARKHFDIESISHRWSTQDFVSIDRVPFVGQHSPFRDDVYVATGFGGWGMTNGTAAAQLLCDLILERETPWRDVYRPTRRPVSSSLPSLAEHGGENAKEVIRDKFGSTPALDDVILSRDDAEVVTVDGDPVGVYRDEAGEIHAVSAVCTHQGCHVSWNDAERTWDCPCHGSRFDYDGQVINTPAVDDLPAENGSLDSKFSE